MQADRNKVVDVDESFVEPAFATSGKGDHGPTRRMLGVLTAVAHQHGATVGYLAARTNLPRGPLSRALENLKDSDLIQSDGARSYRITPDLNHAATKARISPPVLTVMDPVVDAIVGAGPFHVDVGWFCHLGDVRLIDSTRRDAALDSRLSLIDDDLAIAAQASLLPDALVLHLAAYLKSAPERENLIVATPHHRALVDDTRKKRAIWSEDGSVVSIPMPSHPGLALRIEVWRLSRPRLNRLKELAAMVLAWDAAHPSMRP